MGLNEWMKEVGHTDQTLAEKLGVSRSAVTQYRLGDRMPRPEILCGILTLSDGKLDALDIIGGLKRGK